MGRPLHRPPRAGASLRPCCARSIEPCCWPWPLVWACGPAAPGRTTPAPGAACSARGTAGQAGSRPAPAASWAAPWPSPSTRPHPTTWYSVPTAACCARATAAATGICWLRRPARRRPGHQLRHVRPDGCGARWSRAGCRAIACQRCCWAVWTLTRRAATPQRSAASGRPLLRWAANGTVLRPRAQGTFGSVVPSPMGSPAPPTLPGIFAAGGNVAVLRKGVNDPDAVAHNAPDSQTGGRPTQPRPSNAAAMPPRGPPRVAATPPHGSYAAPHPRGRAASPQRGEAVRAVRVSEHPDAVGCNGTIPRQADGARSLAPGGERPGSAASRVRGVHWAVRRVRGRYRRAG